MQKRYYLLIAAVVAVVAAGFFFTRDDSSSSQATDADQFDAQLGQLLSELGIATERSQREWEQLEGLEEAIAAGKKNVARISEIMTMQVGIGVPHDDVNATAYYNAIRDLVRLEFDHEQGWLTKLQSLRTDAEFGLAKGEIRDTNERYRARLKELVRQSQSNFARAHGLRLVAANRPTQ